MRKPAIQLVLAACSLGVAMPASAADIRAQLTPDLIYNHCKTAGVGSETEGTFMLSSGRVTGTLLCTETDLAAPAMAASREHDDDDDDHGRHRHDDDDEDDREDDDRDN